MIKARAPVAQWIERRPPEPDGLSVVLALSDPDGNCPGFTLYGSRTKHCTPAILVLRNHEDLHARTRMANLPRTAEVRLDG
jgi:hypothetical protein